MQGNALGRELQEAALGCGADNPTSTRSLQARVAALEEQLVGCASELASTCAELAAAREDLDRDEIIFAAKMQEASALQARLAEVLEQARLAEVSEQAGMLGELRHERNETDEEASGKRHGWGEAETEDSSRQPDQLLGESSGVRLDAPSRCSSGGPELPPRPQLHQASFWEALHRWGDCGSGMIGWMSWHGMTNIAEQVSYASLLWSTFSGILLTATWMGAGGATGTRQAPWAVRRRTASWYCLMRTSRRVPVTRTTLHKW